MTKQLTGRNSPKNTSIKNVMLWNFMFDFKYSMNISYSGDKNYKCYIKIVENKPGTILDLQNYHILKINVSLV